MAGWGVRLVGFSSVMGALDDIKVQLDDDAVRIVGTNVEYSVYIALGTRHMEARPYLRPAAREAERKMATIVAPAQDMEEAVERVALFIERRAKEILTAKGAVDTGNLRASIETRKVN